MPRIPIQIPPEQVDKDTGFIIGDMQLHMADGSVFVRAQSPLGEGSSGRIETVQFLKHPSKPELIGTFMTVKVFKSRSRYQRAIFSFDLQKDIVYETDRIGNDLCIIRPFVYGEVLSNVLFENKKKRPLTFQLQLDIAIATVTESYTRFEQKDLVHRALKPENIIWDIETKKATVIDEEDVQYANDLTSYLPSHSRLYRPPEIKKEPTSPAGDRYSVGVILADVFSSVGIDRQSLSSTVTTGGHVENYLNGVIDTTTTEGLIRKEIQNISRRLASEVSELRPTLLLVQQVLEKLNQLNMTNNPAQGSVLRFIQSSQFDKKHFPLSIEIDLLAFYQAATEVPSQIDLEKQTQQLIIKRSQCDDPEAHSDISIYLLENLVDFMSDKEADEIHFLLFPEKYSYRKIPSDIVLNFLIYFADRPHDKNYADKLDQLFIQKLAQANSLQALGQAYTDLELRMGMTGKNNGIIHEFLTQKHEELQRKVMTLYLRGLEGIVSPDIFIQSVLDKYRDNLEASFQANYGIQHLLAFGGEGELARLYQIVINSKQPGADPSKVQEAAKALINQYRM